MTIRDSEVVEALRDEPELLALADAVHDTQPAPPSHRTRRVVPGLAAVAVAVGAIVLVVLLVPDRAARHGVIGRAIAAIGNRPVLHLRVETPSGLVYVDLASGRKRPLMVQNEIWFDRDTKHLHYLTRAQGKVADFVWPDDAQPGDTFNETIDPSIAAFWTGFREALEKGDAKVEREGVLYGRPIYWIRFTSGAEVAIDQRSYKPVLFRDHAKNGTQQDERVLVAETLAYRAEDFKRRGPNLFDLTQVGGGYSLDLPPKKPVVKAPWLTAGASVAGLPLSAVSETTQSTKTRTARGVVLIYGNVRGNPDLTIEEYRTPVDLNTWNGIPSGAIAVQPAANGGTATGSLVKHGIYITINAKRGEKELLDVARALRPAG